MSDLELLTLPILAISHLNLAATKRQWGHWGLTIYALVWAKFLLFEVADALTDVGW